MPNPYKFGSLWREAGRFFGPNPDEPRGRPTKIDSERALSEFVELEARARLIAGGQLTQLLRHPDLRVRSEGKWERLNQKDRNRIRKRFQIGKWEVESWEKMRIHYGYPGPVPKPADAGEPHPIYQDTIRRLEERVAELKADRKALFFLTGM